MSPRQRNALPLKALPARLITFPPGRFHRRLVEMIADRYDITLEQLATETQDRLGKDDSYLLDSTKLQKELNWSPEISRSRASKA